MKEKTENTSPKYRTFNICTDLVHRNTGKSILGDGTSDGASDTVKSIIKKHKSIRRSAFAIHDCDKFDDGNIKPPHMHIVLTTTDGIRPANKASQIQLSSVAKWFGLDENFVRIPSGPGAFLDCIQYLTHEMQPEKTQYGDEIVHADFDWRKAVDELNQYGVELTEIDRLRMKVMYEGKSLDSCANEEPLLYTKHFLNLEQCHARYLKKQKPPSNRICIYITGGGGIGKGILSKAIANSISLSRWPEALDLDKHCFTIGGSKVQFESYDGQHVIIWDDTRPGPLLSAFGRSGVFNLFDPHPAGSRVNVKYSFTSLVNEVNILNGVGTKGLDSCIEFLDQLAGEYKDREGNVHTAEDKGQACRRFPILINLELDEGNKCHYEMWINVGVYEKNPKKYSEYKLVGKYPFLLPELIKSGKTKGRENEFYSSSVVPIITYMNQLLDETEDVSIEEQDKLLLEMKETMQRDSIIPTAETLFSSVDEEEI